MSCFLLFPNEIWLNIIQYVDDIDTLRDIAILKPELFHLHVHDFDERHHKPQDLTFECLYDYQMTHAPTDEQIHIHEVMQRYIESKRVSHNNQSVDFECWNPTINSRNFQSHYHNEKQINKPLIYLFNITGELLRVLNNKSTPTDSLDFDNYGSFLWEYKFPEFYQFRNLTKLELFNKTNLPYHKSDLLMNLNDRCFPSLKILEIDGSYSFQPFPLSIDNCQLTNLEKLKLRNVSLKSFSGIYLPNLIVFDLDLRSRYNEHHHDLLLTGDELRPLTKLPSFLSIHPMLEIMQYVNTSFDSTIKFSKLKDFRIKLPLNNIQLMRDPIFLYFLKPNGVIPFESLINFRIDIDKNVISGEGGTLLDFIQDGLEDVLIQSFSLLRDIESFALSSRTEFYRLGVSLMMRLSQLSKLSTVAISPVLIDELLPKFFELSNCEYCQLDYDLESCKDFIRIVSLHLRELTLNFEPTRMLTNNHDLNYIEYLESFNLNCPNLTTLNLTFANKLNLITDDNFNPNINNEFIFQCDPSLRLNLTNITRLKLELELCQFFKFIFHSSIFNTPKLQELTVKYFLNGADALLLSYFHTEKLLHSMQDDELSLDLKQCSQTLQTLNISLSPLLYIAGASQKYQDFEKLLREKLKSLVIDFGDDKAINFHKIRYVAPTSSLLHTIKLPTSLKSNNVQLVKASNPMFVDEMIDIEDEDEDVMNFAEENTVFDGNDDFDDTDDMDMAELTLESLVIEYY